MNIACPPEDFSSALEPLLAQAATQLAAPLLIADRAGKIMWVNQAFCQLCGYSAEELIGKKPSVLKSGRHGPDFYAQLWQTLNDGHVWHGKIVDQRKDGSLYTAVEQITPLRDSDGAIRHFAALQQDISASDAAYQEEHYLARHDPLTGLPNRTMLQEIEQRAFALARRNNQLVGCLFVDLDGFKTVNDTHGHYLGDQLLTAVAERLRSALRQSDNLARVGGDEFVALIEGISEPHQIDTAARNLLNTLGHPFVVRGEKFTIRASIGVALFPDHASRGDLLIDYADRAMYQAKLQGGNRYQLFEPSFARAMLDPKRDSQAWHS